MSGRAVIVTLVDLQERIEQIRKKMTKEEIERLVTRWKQGRVPDLPLEKIESLLIKSKDVKEAVRGAAQIILDHLKSSYGGVEIFTMESTRPSYGTGKTQIAYLTCVELKKMGVYAVYTAVKLNDVRNGRFRDWLWEIGGSREEAVLFLDEVDVLVSPELREEERRAVIQAFANAVIEYSENLSGDERYRQALVLVLSHKAREYRRRR